MKINLSLRLKNKTTLVALVSTLGLYKKDGENGYSR